MNTTTLKRIIRAGLQSFWRGAFVSVASILVMTVTLFIIGVTLFAGVILRSGIDELRNKADVSIYFLADAPEERMLEMKASLEARPEVSSVSYVSREQALAEFRERYKDDQLTLQALDELGDNPLQASLQVQARDISQYEAIAEFAREQDALEEGVAPTIDKISFYDENYRTALARLQGIVDSASRLGFFVIVALIATTIAISFNTLRLAIYTSRDEIHVMRLVGAGSFYIRAPFMVEGLLYGLVAGVATLLLFYPLTWWLGSATADFFGGINVFSYYVSNFFLIAGLILGTGALLGAVASFLAVRRYLKV